MSTVDSPVDEAMAYKLRTEFFAESGEKFRNAQQKASNSFFNLGRSGVKSGLCIFR